MPSVLSTVSLDGGAVTLNQILSASHRDGATPVIEMAGGSIDPSLIGIQNFEPVSQFTTSDILTALGLTGGTFLTHGYFCEDLSVIPLNSRADGGVFDDGSVHGAIQGTTGLLVPTSIEAPADGATATLQAEMHWKSADGSTVAVTSSTGNALATGSFIGSYACGKASLNGAQITELQSFTVNPGLTIAIQRESGLPQPVKVFITKREPTIDLVFENQLQAIAALNAAAIVSGSGGAAVFLRKRADMATYVADASLAHIKLSFASGITRFESFAGVAANGNNSFTLRLHGKQLVAATGVAIT
jgi:hypothetical protein